MTIKPKYLSIYGIVVQYDMLIVDETTLLRVEMELNDMEECNKEKKRKEKKNLKKRGEEEEEEEL